MDPQQMPGLQPQNSQTFQDMLNTGSMKSFRDIVNMRKYDFPEIQVCDPRLHGSVSKHHVYTVKGKD